MFGFRNLFQFENNFFYYVVLLIYSLHYHLGPDTVIKRNYVLIVGTWEEVNLVVFGMGGTMNADGGLNRKEKDALRQRGEEKAAERAEAGLVLWVASASETEIVDGAKTSPEFSLGVYIVASQM